MTTTNESNGSVNDDRNRFAFLMRPEEWAWWRREYPEMTTTATTYEWCEVCARNVADDLTHELRHHAIEHPNRVTRRAALRANRRKVARS